MITAQRTMGTFGISADLKAALDSALSQQGSAEFKIEYKGANL